MHSPTGTASSNGATDQTVVGVGAPPLQGGKPLLQHLAAEPKTIEQTPAVPPAPSAPHVASQNPVDILRSLGIPVVTQDPRQVREAALEKEFRSLKDRVHTGDQKAMDELVDFLKANGSNSNVGDQILGLLNQKAVINNDAAVLALLRIKNECEIPYNFEAEENLRRLAEEGNYFAQSLLEGEADDIPRPSTSSDPVVSFALHTSTGIASSGHTYGLSDLPNIDDPCQQPPPPIPTPLPSPPALSPPPHHPRRHAAILTPPPSYLFGQPSSRQPPPPPSPTLRPIPLWWGMPPSSPQQPFPPPMPQSSTVPLRPQMPLRSILFPNVEPREVSLSAVPPSRPTNWQDLLAQCHQEIEQGCLPAEKIQLLINAAKNNRDIHGPLHGLLEKLSQHPEPAMRSLGLKNLGRFFEEVAQPPNLEIALDFYMRATHIGNCDCIAEIASLAVKFPPAEGALRSLLEHPNHDFRSKVAYNLALIEEKRGHLPEAINIYTHNGNYKLAVQRLGTIALNNLVFRLEALTALNELKAKGNKEAETLLIKLAQEDGLEEAIFILTV